MNRSGLVVSPGQVATLTAAMIGGLRVGRPNWRRRRRRKPATLSRDFLQTELFGHEKGAYTGAVMAKPGLLEAAYCGTLFLDEIGDMDLDVQPKLLKVLEEKRFRRMGETRDRRVDVRLIVATHQGLRGLVRERRFREDLCFRISTVPLIVPPLRDRAEDLPRLARELLDRSAGDVGRRPLSLGADAEAALCGYQWPGNIRELRNVLERAALLTDRSVLRISDLRFDNTAEAPLPQGTDTRLTLLEVEHTERTRLHRITFSLRAVFIRGRDHVLAAKCSAAGTRTRAAHIATPADAADRLG